MASWYTKQAFQVGPETPASAKKKQSQGSRFSGQKSAAARKSPKQHHQDQPGTPRPKQGARRTLASELTIPTPNKNKEVFEPNLSQLTESTDPSKSSALSNQNSQKSDEQRSLLMQESSETASSGGTHDDSRSYEGCCLGQPSQNSVFSRSARSASTSRRFASQRSSNHGYGERPSVHRSSSFDPSSSRGSSSMQGPSRSPSLHHTRNKSAPNFHRGGSKILLSDPAYQQSIGMPRDSSGQSIAREPMTPLYYTQPPMTPRSQALQLQSRKRDHTPVATPAGRTPLASNTNRYMTPNRTRKMMQETFQEMFREFEARGVQVGENLDSKGNAIADRLCNVEQEILQGFSKKLEEGQTAIAEMSDQVHAERKEAEAKDEERRQELANEKSEILRLESKSKENYEKAEELHNRLVKEMQTEKDTLAQELVPMVVDKSVPAVVDKAVPLIIDNAVPVVVEKSVPSLLERVKSIFPGVFNNLHLFGKKRSAPSPSSAEESSSESPAKKQRTSVTSESSGGNEPKVCSPELSSGSIQLHHNQNTPATKEDKEAEGANKITQDLIVATPSDRGTTAVQCDTKEVGGKSTNRHLIVKTPRGLNSPASDDDLTASAALNKKGSSNKAPPRRSNSKKAQANSEEVSRQKKGSSDKAPPRRSNSKTVQTNPQVARKKKESNEKALSRRTISKSSDASGQKSSNNHGLKVKTPIRPTVSESLNTEAENTNNQRRSSRARKEVNYNVDKQFNKICPNSAFRETINPATQASKTTKKPTVHDSGNRHESSKATTTAKSQQRASTPKKKGAKVKILTTNDDSGGKLVADTRSPHSVVEHFNSEAPPSSFVTHTQDSFSTISDCLSKKKIIESTSQRRPKKKDIEPIQSDDITCRGRKRKRDFRSCKSSSEQPSTDPGGSGSTQQEGKKLFTIKKHRNIKKYGTSRQTVMDYADDSAFDFTEP